VRVAFLVLLLLNIAFLAYTRIAGESGEPAGAEAGPSIAALKLAGEGRSGPRCATLGPFLSQAGVQRAAASPLAAAYRPRVHSADAPGPSSYWVVISTKTLQDANKIGMRLRAAGVADLVIMPPEVNSTESFVSLGIYSDRERADRRVQDLKRYAVSPKIVEQPHTVTTWWMDLELGAGVATPDTALLAKASGESTSLRASTCAAPPATTLPVAAPAAETPPAANPPAAAAAGAKLPGAPT